MNRTFTGSVSVPELECSNVFLAVDARLHRRLAKLRRDAAGIFGLVLILPAMAVAQGSSAPSRVTDRVNLGQLTTLAGHVHQLAQAKYDQGAAPPDLPMNRMMLLLKRSAAQESALQDLLAQQQVTSSANYRKWLTPDQFGQQFGPSDSDIQAVTSWLGSFGFQSIKVSRGRTVIEFSGTAAQVQSALHTTIHKYFVNGEYHWANTSDPQVPSALAPVIAGVASMHNFHPKPAMVLSEQKLKANVVSGAPGAKPQINLQDQNGNLVHALVPADFNTIYNIAPTMTGAGVTIGIVSNANINVQDVADFRNQWRLPVNNPNFLNVIVNGPDPGDIPMSPQEGEAVLDATWSGAVAPQATVDLVVSEDTNATAGTDLSEFYIIDNNLADVMTESFEACESAFNTQGQLSAAANFYSGMAEQAAAQGISFSVASGDGGPDACDDPSTNPTTPTAASVNILASSPFDVAVGGTEFHDCDPLPGCTDTVTKYWQSTNAATTSESAKGYIPENVWNEACTTLSASCAATGIWSSGGGQSVAFPRPVWQAGVTGIPTANARFLPDVAMNAANHDGYVLCIDASCPSQFAIASGTSASAQAFGGVMALVVQKMGGRVGNPNYALYKLAATETFASCDGSGSPALVNATDNCIFNDVTKGDTNIPGETGFTAGTGYDETTGLGSVNVSNLVNNWHSAIVASSTTSMQLNQGNAVNIVHGTPVRVGITVSPVAPAVGPPTGDVSLISSDSNSDQGMGAFYGATGFSGFTLTASGNNGIVSSLSNGTNLLPGGTYHVHAHYAGDGKFLGSDSAAVSVTVSRENSQINFGIVVINQSTGACSSTATSVPYGSPYVLTVDVSDLNVVSTPCAPNESGSSPTGTVTVTDSFNGGTALPLDGGTFKLNSGGYFEDQPIQLLAGTHRISASYAGDNSFNASGPAAGTITVTRATTSISVAASQTAVASGTPVTLTATVATQSNAVANASQEPTQTVQFLLNGQNLGSPVTVTGGVNSITQFAQATAVLTQTLANGQNVITAKYSGDSNYAASGPSTSVTVSVGAPGINITPASNTATINISAPGQSGSQAITVSAAGGFTGTVTLTCSVGTAMTGVSDTPTCAFTPAATINLTSSTTSGQQTLMVNTTAASHLPMPVSRRHGPGVSPLQIGEVGAVLACLFLLTLAAKKRSGALVLASLLLAVVAFGASCGSSGNGGGGGGNPGTTTGAYSVTVTATPPSGSGASAQTTTIAVNVR